MNTDFSSLEKLITPFWRMLKTLFAEHHFITILGGFFVLMMTLSFYRFLRSISPALVAIIFLLVLFILMLHWTQTRTEPALLEPAVDWLTAFSPKPSYISLQR